MLIRTFIAEDEIRIRNLYVKELSCFDNIEIVGEAGDGDEVMKLLKGNVADVLLLDLHLPKVHGIEVLEWIAAEKNPVKPLVVSMHDDVKEIKKALIAGALGFLNKTETWEETHAAICDVSKGRFHNTDMVNPILLEIINDLNSHQRTSLSNRFEFTERELTIFKSLKKGLTSEDIGDLLYCSKSNADHLRQKLKERIGAKTTAELIEFAIRHGLV